MQKVLVIGGAGFIGSNLSAHFLDKGAKVIVFDNFSRKGSQDNLEWLKSKEKNLEVMTGDIRYDSDRLSQAVSRADAVFHLAAQVAVTTSVMNPREDFEINAGGTFNVLEAVRTSRNRPVLFFSSTNKVYGGMEDVGIHEVGGKYAYQGWTSGIPEGRGLDFHSPYGCSKGCADQYVRDYSRIYGLSTVVFRKSCIYGYRQFGVEDQGWVAWFTIAALLGRTINIYGDGKQVRDVLFIDDLIDAYQKAWDNIKTTSGKIYNIGGGPKNQMSLLELIGFLEKEFDRKIELAFANWRPGDQPVFVSDISKSYREFGWEPKIGVQEGVRRLAQWVKENKDLFKKN